MLYIKKHNAFTMIELVFVIVILGILAAVAIPRFAATRDDAQIAKGRSDVAAIRAAIVTERQTRLLRGDSSYIAQLDSAGTTAGETLFDGNTTAVPPRTLLMYGVISAAGNGHWMKTGTTAYTYKVLNTDVSFSYNATNGTFTCTGTYCSDLTN